MNAFRMAARAALAALLSLQLWSSAGAQTDRVFVPEIGQAGKDVIWVPSPDEIVLRMLRMAQTTPDDYVIDLGAGDGKIAIAAAQKFGARSLGIEYDGEMAAYAQKNVVRAGVSDRARIQRGDIFTTDFSSATVLTMYLLPALNMKLRPSILSMKPGTRVVSHSFMMEDWEPDEVSNMDGRHAYFWIVPSNVQGRWTLALEDGSTFDLRLDQRFQKVRGSVDIGAVEGGLRQVRLEGTDIAFAFVDATGLRRDFRGQVDGNVMEGTLRTHTGTDASWRAVRR